MKRVDVILFILLVVCLFAFMLALIATHADASTCHPFKLGNIVLAGCQPYE